MAARFSTARFSATSQLTLPPFSPAREARDNALLWRLGLGGAWNFVGTRFTATGRGWLLATGAWFLWGVNALELQAHVPLLYALCLWLIAAGTLRMAKPRLTLRARHADRISAGQSCPVEFEVEAKRALACRIVPRALPQGLGYFPEEGAALVSDGSRASLCLHAQRRGVYTLRGWRAMSDYPFGVLRAWHDTKEESRLVVVPAFTPLTRFDFGAAQRGNGGAQNLRLRGESDEFSGNRPFRTGDAVRHIDWRATARRQNLTVREWHSQPLLRAAVVLDSRADPAQDALFERSVSLCAAVADYLARAGYQVELFAAGAALHHLQTGAQQAFLDEILDLLACVERTTDKSGEATLSPIDQITPHLNGIDTLFYITLDSSRARAELAEAAASRSLLHALIVCDDALFEDAPESSADNFLFVPQAAQDAGIL